MAAGWAGLLCSGREQGPPRNCPPRWKVTGKCRGNRPRARRAPASGTNATFLPPPPPRAAPTPAPAGSWVVWFRRPGTGTRHIGQSWVELPPERCPGRPSPFPSAGLVGFFSKRETEVQRSQGPNKNQKRTEGPAGLTVQERETSRFGDAAQCAQCLLNLPEALSSLKAT